MTIVKILCEELQKTELKKIKFKKYLRDDSTIDKNIVHNPNDWDEVILLCRNYKLTGLDLFFCKDDKANCLYLGHFNDGVV